MLSSFHSYYITDSFKTTKNSSSKIKIFYKMRPIIDTYFTNFFEKKFK